MPHITANLGGGAVTLGVALVVVVLIVLLIARPGLALVLFVIGVAGFIAFFSKVDSEGRKRAEEYEAAKQRALSAIKADDLDLRDVTLGGVCCEIPNEPRASFQLTGMVTNNSGYDLKYIEFEVTITDCASPSVACQTVGQGHSGVDVDVPPKQARHFETTAIVFNNIPDPGRCLDNAPATWRHATTDRQGCQKGRSYAWKITEIEAGGFGYFVH